MGFGSLGLGVTVTKMGMGNTSAIIKTVIVGHFLSPIAKIKGIDGEKVETNHGYCPQCNIPCKILRSNKHLYLLIGKTSSKRSNETQNCVLKLDVTMKNLLRDFFLISVPGLGFGLKKGWEIKPDLERTWAGKFRTLRIDRGNPS